MTLGWIRLGIRTSRFVDGRMFGTERRDSPNDGNTAIGCQSAWNDFHAIGNGRKGSLLNALYFEGCTSNATGDGHFRGTATGQQFWIVDNVADDLHCILQIAFNFIQDILTATPQDNRTRLGVTTFVKETEPFISNFAHFEKSTIVANIRFLQFVGPGTNRGTGGAGNAIVIRFAEATKGGNIGLGQIMLGQITDALFGNDNVWLERNDIRTHAFDVLFFHFQHDVPILFVGDFDVGLRFALFIFERRIQEKDAWIFNPTSHFGMRRILVEHDSLQNGAIVNFPTGNLFDFGISLQIDFGGGTIG
mmetsp:Transcript_17122/g.28443  ORF Transcript_17122/g.28443 Transcript_17122/m.28443 type:complete len:305 (-) Transcript_17122:706-1620(-)